MKYYCKACRSNHYYNSDKELRLLKTSAWDVPEEW